MPGDDSVLWLVRTRGNTTGHRSDDRTILLFGEQMTRNEQDTRSAEDCDLMVLMPCVSTDSNQCRPNEYIPH